MHLPKNSWLKTLLLPAVTSLVVAPIAYQMGFNNAPKPSHQVEQSVEGVETTISLQPNLTSPSPALAQDNAAIEEDPLPVWHQSEEFEISKALRALNRLSGPKRLDYCNDLFTFLANNGSPQEALEAANSLRHNSDYAKRILVTEWHLASQNLSEHQEEIFRRNIMSVPDGPYGIEVQLSKQLAQSNLSAEVKEAWRESHLSDVNRSQIQAIFDSNAISRHPETILTPNSEWTPWEQKNYQRELLNNWAQRSPKQAWDWYSQNANALDPSLSNEIFSQWAKRSPRKFADMAESISDYDLRQQAIKTSATALAYTSTGQAVAWADKIQDSNDRQLAYETIYENSIKGIGAVIDSANGLTRIKHVIPNGPLNGKGIQSGDMIAEAIEADGSRYDLYGKEIGEVIKMLGGEPGSSIQLKILRTNPQTGVIEEKVVQTNRDLLNIDRKNLKR